MRFVSHGNPRQRFCKCGASGCWIVLEKFPGHVRLNRMKVGSQGPENLEHRRNIIRQGNIHCLNLRPKRKPAVSNDKRVGMAHARDQRQNLRVKDCGVEHTESGMSENEPKLTRGFKWLA